MRSVREWIFNPLVYRRHGNRVTFGVQNFLSSSFGGGLFDCFSGARSVRNTCKSRGASFRSIIGTGDRRIMTALADLLDQKKIRAVIDSRFTMDHASDALVYQRKGRAAGKVVIEIVVDKKKKKSGDDDVDDSDGVEESKE